MSPALSQDHANGQERAALSFAELLLDLLGRDALLRVGQGERLYKLYCFRPAWGRRERVEHRVLTKQRADGTLELISYTRWIPPGGQPARSNVLRVPEMPIQALERIIAQILAQTRTDSDEFEEVDLTDFNTLDEQLDYLRGYLKSPG
ncbi:MAG: hypothetical protein RML36_01300 [Anaerolineae bacterium]|nr:hypothetical protein [Anaerolineae bacterium]MDW8098105.1 hypothetical protein [Anaerolineae bacterium]